MAEVVRYVDPDAPGPTHDGTSWNDAYLSLSAWEANEQTDLVSDGNWMHVYCRASSGTADTTAIDIDGWTTGASNYIKIEAASTDRAGTTWSTSDYRYSITDAPAMMVREDYIWFDGLQIEMTGLSAGRYFFQNVVRSSGWIKISNCVLKGDGSAYRHQLYTESTGTFTDIIMWNTLMYNWGSESSAYFLVKAGATATLYNCTFIGNGATYTYRNDGGTLTMNNCYGGGAATADYFGTITKTTCAASDTSADIDNIAINTTNFTDVTIDGGEDWSLPAGSGLIGVGTDDVYADAATDINGETRTSTWDAGADEYVAAAGGQTMPLISSAGVHNTMFHGLVIQGGS